MQTTTTTTTIITVPFSSLFRADENVRTQGKAENIEALAASIASTGLLQNLVGYTEGDRTGIVAGGRRLAAIGLLVEQGRASADFPVSVKVVDKSEATAASLTENEQREDMHPADAFEAFKKLQDEGFTIDRIADAFGVTALVVERRLRLCAAAPELIAEFRDGEISTDQMIALCTTDDHARQVAVWKRAQGTYMERPETLRKMLIDDTEIDGSTDNRVKFIGGVEVYKAAGGAMRGDLFSENGAGGFLTDAALLESLVSDKLEAEAAKYRAQGWGWVDVWPLYDWEQANRLGEAPESVGELSPENAAKLADLQAELAKSEAEIKTLQEGDDELTEEESERLDVLYEAVEQNIPEAIEELTAESMTYAPEVKALAGVVVSRQGAEMRVLLGKVKTTDRKALAEATGNPDAVQGGRETQSAGRKTDAVSDALRRSLQGHRNLAVQTVVASRPDVAKILMAVWSVKQIRQADSRGYGPGAGMTVPTDLAVSEGWSGVRTGCRITDASVKDKEEAFDAVCEASIADLPKAEGALWDALAAKTGEELDAIIACAIARSVSVSEEHKGLTAKLIDALGFDMADHFEPTADNYFGRVSKPLMIAALTEAKKIETPADRTALEAMKKGALAAESEKRMAGAGWVPKGIRTPKPKQAATKPAAKKAAPKKAPAKKSAKAKAKA